MISIIIGIVSCLLTRGFFIWNGNNLRESLVRSGIGHYQLYKKGYFRYGNEEPFSYLISNPYKILKDLKEMKEIELVTTRLQFNGILSSGKKSTIVSGEAGVPENEDKLNTFLALKEGKGLAKSKTIVVGEGVAKKLSIKIGDTLTLMCNAKGGGINALDFILIGILKTGYSEVDNIFATISLEDAGYLLNTGSSVQKIIILLRHTEDTTKVLTKIEEICKKYNLEYKTWKELADFYESVKKIYDVLFVVIISIVLFIVTFTISNTVNMNIYDRIREIGTIRAIGTTRFQIAGIFITESSLIGIIGSTLGLIVTYLFIFFVEIIEGLPVIVNNEIVKVFFKPDLPGIISCFILFTFVSILASLSSSYRASKLSIVEALRWI